MVYLVTDANGGFYQKKTMYHSLNVGYLIEKLSVKFDVKRINHFDMANDKFNEDDIFIFTSSQIMNYKSYLEDMLLVHKDYKTIPSIESLLAHENKRYQGMYLKKLGRETIKTDYYGDFKDLREYIYPIVVKGLDGSSSRNVKICKSKKEAIRFIKKLERGRRIGELLNTSLIHIPFLFKATSSHSNFIVQEMIENLKGDYRIQIMGDKFYAYYRELKPNKKYSSGNGSVNKYSADVPREVLDYAYEFAKETKNYTCILDVAYTEKKEIKMFEFSGVHIGPSAFQSKSDIIYYSKVSDVWVKNIEKNYELKFEDELVESWYKLIGIIEDGF